MRENPWVSRHRYLERWYQELHTSRILSMQQPSISFISSLGKDTEQRTNKKTLRKGHAQLDCRQHREALQGRRTVPRGSSTWHSEIKTIGRTLAVRLCTSQVYFNSKAVYLFILKPLKNRKENSGKIFKLIHISTGYWQNLFCGNSFKLHQLTGHK